MTNKLLLFALIGGALAACAGPAGSKNGGRQAQQTPVGESFAFKNQAKDFEHDGDDPKAEAARISVLEDALRTNQMCQRGYKISSRRVIVQLGEKDEVDYEGRCNP